MLKTVGNPSTRYGDQTIVDGNLVVGTAGKGIDFSADGQATGMTSKLLDDYEEGTWTPVLSDGTNNATTSFAVGRYTKVGRNVTVFCNLGTSELGSTTGAIRITGLPFTVAATPNGVDFSAIAVGQGGGLNITAGQNVGGTFAANNTYIRLQLSDSAAGTTSLQASEWSDDGFINFTGTYMVG